MKKFNLIPLAGIAAATLTTVPFASSTAPPGITAEMLAPLSEGVFANIGVILPIGVSIFGLLLGIGILPRIVKGFTK